MRRVVDGAVVVGIVAVLVVAFAICVIVWYCGSNNPHTPAGYVGYVYQNAWFGESRFVGIQTGPSSAGRHWLYQATNVSITPYTYAEPFEGEGSILAKDDLKVSFRIHVVWKVREDKMKDFVEKYATLHEGGMEGKLEEVAFAHFMKEPIRTYGRDEVQKFKGPEIKERISEIGAKILARARKRAEGTPYEILDVVVGNIQYPSVVSDAVAMKLKADQDLARMAIEVDIEKRRAEKRIVEADGIAKAMTIINEKLTPQYLQHEAIEAQRAMVGSTNHTTVYIPVGNMGVPLVGTFDVAPPKKEKK